MEEEVKKAKKLLSGIKKGAKVVTFVAPLLPVFLIIILVVVICSGFIYFITVDAADWSSDPSYSSYTQNTKITENGVETDIDAILDEALQKNGFTDEEIQQIRKELEEKGYSGEKLDKEVRKKKMDLLGIEPSSDDYSDAEIIWLLNEEKYAKYLEDYTQLEYLLNAEFIIQAPYISSLGKDNVKNGKIHLKRTLNDGSNVEMEYTSKDKFNKLVENCSSENDNNVFKKFTINDNGKIEVAYWQKNIVTFETNDDDVTASEYDSRFQNGDTYSNFTCLTQEISISNVVSKKYTLPFAYLWDLLVVSEDYDFVSGLAKLAYDTEIHLTIFDNQTENTTENVKNYTIQTKKSYRLENLYYNDSNTDSDVLADSDIYYTDENVGYRIVNGIKVPNDEITNVEKYIKIVETSTSNIVSPQLTYADTWIARFTPQYNSTTMGQKYINGGENTPQSDPIINKIENGQAVILESKMVKILNNDGETTYVLSNDGDDYSLISETTKQQINITNTTSTFSYSSSAIHQTGNNDTTEKIDKDGFMDNNGNKISETFSSLFIDNEKARERILDYDVWLFEMMEMNSETSDMIDLTKYLINEALNDERYDVGDFDFSKYKKSLFSGISFGNVSEMTLIGYLSHKFEASQGPFVIGGEGGLAYGTYQFHVDYALKGFVDYCYEKDPETYELFGQFYPASLTTKLADNHAKVTEAWNKIAAESPEKLEADIDEYAYIAYWVPCVNAYNAITGRNLEEEDWSIKASVFSDGIRNGANVENLSKSITNPSLTDPEEIIEMMYTNRYNRASDKEKPRYIREKEEALKILRGENEEFLAYMTTVENDVVIDVANNGSATSTGDSSINYASQISNPDILKVVNFALSQEGRSDGQIEWTNGRSAQNEAWCAHFVSNAFNKFGFLNSKIPYGWTSAASGTMYYWQPQISKNQKPNPGDIITYEPPKSHVGLVYAVDDMYVYTIEGNCSNLCKRVTRLRSDGTIKGYISTSSYF
ncbi:MAG: CHAP domain-containing protein [Clostridia bacterium]|nr:CHAP domain-containing protein [Clostridia bacterium]